MGMYTKDTYNFTKPQRRVKAVFCHCSASDNPAHDNVATMYDWHVNGNGWSDVGYHIYIRKDGTIEDGRSLEQTPAAQSGYNTDTIAISCGGLEEFTMEQADALYTICDQINLAYSKDMYYYGHNQVASKACPVYDWTKILNLDTGYQMTTSNIDDGMNPGVPPSTGNPDIPTDGDLSSNFPFWENSPFKGHEADMPVVGKGDKGFSVALLQYLMATIKDITISVDGNFGPKTEAKVKKIQETFNLDVDGIVGADTWAAITHLRAVMVGLATVGIRNEIENTLGEFRIEDLGDPEQFKEKLAEKIAESE
jgi:peptidoglycan hydrolase-like protein with peptidoglycan-binding domain